MTVTTAFTAIDRFSKTVGKMHKGVKRFANKTQIKLAKLERKWRAVGDRAASVGRKAALFATALIVPLGVAVNEAVKFEAAMGNVATLIDTNVENIDDMGSRVLELAEKIPVPLEELTAGLYAVRSAGISAADQFEVLEAAAKLSVAGLATTEEATKLLVGAMNTFKHEGLSASDTADILFRTVKSGITDVSQLTQAFGATSATISEIGIGLADFQAATAALTTTTTPASVAQRQLVAAVTALNKPTAEMQKLFDDIGVKTGKELISSSENIGDAFNKINASAEKLDVNLARAWSSTEAYNGVMSLTNATSEAYLTTLESMQGGVNELNVAFQKQLLTGKSQLQLAKNQLKSISITIGQALLPVLVDLLQALAPMLKSFGRWAKENKKMLSTIVKVVAAVAAFSAGVSGIAFVISGFAKVMVFGLRAVQMFNAGLLSTPVGWIVAGIGAIGVAVYALTRNWSRLSDEERLARDLKEDVISAASDQLVQSKLLFRELERLQVGTEEYNNVLAKLEEMQPGITKQYNLQEGALKDLAAAEAALTKNIMERATAQAVAEKMSETMKEIVELQLEGPEKESFWGVMDQETLNQIHSARIQGLQGQFEMLANVQTGLEMGQFDQIMQGTFNPLNTEAAANEETINNNTTESSEVTIDFKNVPVGTQITQTGGGAGINMPALGTTN